MEVGIQKKELKKNLQNKTVPQGGSPPRPSQSTWAPVAFSGTALRSPPIPCFMRCGVVSVLMPCCEAHLARWSSCPNPACVGRRSWVRFAFDAGGPRSG